MSLDHPPPKEFPGRLYHHTPGWAKDAALFHIRLRVEPPSETGLTESRIAASLLSGAKYNHEAGNWWCELFLLMPDHLHALMAFPREPGMTATIKNWKRYTARFLRLRWQENYFDRRMRTQKESAEKWCYIRRNPVVKGLCADEEAWPWWWGVSSPSRLFDSFENRSDQG